MFEGKEGAKRESKSFLPQQFGGYQFTNMKKRSEIESRLFSSIYEDFKEQVKTENLLDSQIEVQHF